jgi:hypothetical protein
MTIRMSGRALALAVALLAAAQGPAAADGAALLTTTILAEAAPQGAAVAIAADARSRTTATAELTVRLTALPATVTPKVCALRVVLAEDIPGGDYGGVLLELQDRAGLPADQPGRAVAALRLRPATPAGTAVLLRSAALCAALRGPLSAAAEADRVVRLSLLTSTRDSRVVVAGAGAEASRDAPRLTVTYEKPGAIPGAADWAQVRRDAQHSGRSPWRMHDPDGRFTPTAFAARTIGGAAASAVLSDLRQSPLLYDGRIFVVIDGGPGRFRLAAIDRSGAVLAERTLNEAPTYLVAGGPGRILYVTENRILEFDARTLGSPLRETPLPGDDTLRDAPTVGGDGTLYLVSQKYVRALTPSGGELWRRPTGERKVAAVALSADETTAYVLLGGTNPRLLALDAASGDCRWEERRVATSAGENDPMPLPVVSGSDILITGAFPTADTLYVVRDRPPVAPADQGATVPPPPVAACQADAEAAPGGVIAVGGPGDHIPTPTAGANDDAFHIRAGRLCWSRAGETATGSDWGTCRPLDGCDEAETREITLLIGDSADGASPRHLYALAGASGRVFFITATVRPDGDLAPRCLRLDVAGAGPNLLLAPDGTLINVSEARGLQAIVPSSLPAEGATLTLTAEHVRLENGATFRAGSTIATESGLAIPAGSSINLVAGERIVFAPGLRIAQGARLRARAGF